MTRPPAVPVLAILSAALAACAGTPDVDPRYQPTENVLEVFAVLRQHVPDDTYRFEPARDFTGRNVYRSSLLRLESLESLHAEAFKAGHMDGVIAFAKGRAFERLRAFDLAAEAYRIGAEREPELAVEALRSADLCDGLQRAGALAPDVDDPPPGADVEAALASFEARDRALEALLREAQGTHHEAIVREEIERNDVARARYFEYVRHVIEDGDVRAVAEAQRVVSRHARSRNANRHLLALADLYADLAMEYADANPPESLNFDPARFGELIDSASRFYEIVASRDGTPEKIEASRRLEAFLAFALRIDRDRFTP
jgi:hypothetical protein